MTKTREPLVQLGGLETKKVAPTEMGATYLDAKSD